jgi:hypothetical protein
MSANEARGKSTFSGYPIDGNAEFEPLSKNTESGINPSTAESRGKTIVLLQS